ncbi:MAG: hypothetical protein H6662_15595 [Ardenticatenaceae bacterium]|nr:hypothetical protein [Ardenticatenaceae bacterium]
MTIEIAYGFVGMQHLFNKRVQEVGVNRVFDAITQSAAEHTQMINTMMEILVERTTVAQEEFELPGSGTLQPLDEVGIPRPTDTYGFYQVAYPIQGGGDAWGKNRVTSALMTVQEANRHTIEAQNKDADWLARHIIASVLTKDSWTFHDKVGAAGNKGLGNITIMPLANGDVTEYPVTGKQPQTANHYTAQAVAIDNSNNPFPGFYSTLTRYPGSKNATIVAYIPENLQESVEALTDFREVEDADVRAGANRDELVGSIPVGLGDELLGKVGKVWVVLWKRLPDNYIFVHARGRTILKMREYPTSTLQGLFTELHSPDGARMENRVIRYAGFGVSNRVAGLVHYVGNAAYQNPTDYTAPLAQ